MTEHAHAHRPNLENSIGLALTVVFVLPELSSVGSDAIHSTIGACDLLCCVYFCGIHAFAKRVISTPILQQVTPRRHIYSAAVLKHGILTTVLLSQPNKLSGSEHT
jgi:hypothetical protein